MKEMNVFWGSWALHCAWRKPARFNCTEQTIICCSLNRWPRLSHQTALRKSAGGAPGLASRNLRWKGIELFAVFDDKDQLVDICSGAWTWRAKRRGRKRKKGRKKTGREQEALESLQLPGHTFRQISPGMKGHRSPKVYTSQLLSAHRGMQALSESIQRSHPISMSPRRSLSHDLPKNTPHDFSLPDRAFPLQKGDLLLRKLFQN